MLPALAMGHLSTSPLYEASLSIWVVLHSFFDTSLWHTLYFFCTSLCGTPHPYFPSPLVEAKALGDSYFGYGGFSLEGK